MVEAYQDLLPRAIPAECERHDLLEDPVLIAMAAGSRGNTSVDLATLADQPWILPRPTTFCHEMVQRACGAAGFVPRPVAHCNDFAATLALVAARVGVALVPQLATRNPPSGIALHRPRRRITRTIFALTTRRGDHHPAVRAVLNQLTTPHPSADTKPGDPGDGAPTADG